MTASDVPYVEGEATFNIPGVAYPCKTWYKVFGDLKGSKHRALVVVHGGPGFSHDYLVPMADLTSKYGIPVVLYDQIGNGLSTHLPEKTGDKAFWTIQLFVDQFNHILSHLGIQHNYDLLGHSWGGVVASEIAVQRPKGLHQLILASTLSSAKSWSEGCMILRKELPQDIQDLLNKHEADGTIDSDEYQKAVDVYMSRFVCLIDPLPKCLADTFAWLQKEPSIYNTMWGHSEFFIIGTLKPWTIVDRLHYINVPTLLTNGRHDEAHEVTMNPFFEHIPKVRWIQFAESSHLPHLEERERYMAVVGNFLA